MSKNKRIQKKGILMAMAAALMLSFTGCGAGAGDSVQEEAAVTGLLTEDAGVKLVKVGEFPNDHIDEYGRNFLYQEDENGNFVRLVDYLGNPLEEKYTYIWSLIGRYYNVVGEADGMTICNVMDAEGKFLFEEEITGMVEDVNSHYLLILFATGTTDDETDFLFYSYSNPFTSMSSPASGDTLYTGYGKLYNLDTGRYIEDLQLSNQSYVGAIGDSVLVMLEDGTVRLYDSTGNMIKDDFDDTYSINDYFISRTADDSTEIYDDSMNLLFTLSGKYELSTSKSGRKAVILTQGFGQTYLYDLSGNLAVETPYFSIYAENDDYYVVVNEEHEEFVFYLPTKEILTSDRVIAVNGDYALVQGDGYALYEKGEQLFEGKAIFSPKLGNYFLEDYVDEEFHAYVFDENDFSLVVKFGEELSDALVAVKGGSPFRYGLYELVSGKQLFDYAYDDITIAYGYLYTLRDDIWTVYKIQSPFSD